MEAPQSAAVRSRLARAAQSVEGGSLGALWRRYASLRSIHLRASVEISQATPESDTLERLGLASYEYWESGERYRISSRTPAALGIFSVEEIAFDGAVFQLFLQGGTLTVGSQDSRSTPAYRNPFVLPIEFLNPSDDLACPACEIRLSDLRLLSADLAPASAAVKALRSFHTLDGGGVDGAATIYTVRAARAAASELLAIEQHRLGSAVTRITFSDYRLIDSGSDWRFPWTIRLEVSDPAQETAATTVFVYRIETLALNPDLDSSIFTLPWSMAQRVWDEERRIFLHSASSHRPRGAAGAPRPQPEPQLP